MTFCPHGNALKIFIVFTQRPSFKSNRVSTRSHGLVAFTSETFLTVSTPLSENDQESDPWSYFHSLFSAIPFLVVVISRVSVLGGFGFLMRVNENGSPATL